MMERNARLNRRGSSSRDFLECAESSYMSKGRTSNSGSHSNAWSNICKAHVADYLVLIALTAVLVFCETATPFSKVFYTASDQEYWRYSYPLKVQNTVPAWTVPLIATAVPLITFAISAIFFNFSRLEFHNLILGLFSAVVLCATITNLVKLGVGRPRPNFVARCWPDGNKKFTASGLPECSVNSQNPGEGRKSFPSGHTAWSTSGLAYLTFWSVGFLKCFDGNGHVSKLVLAGMPVAFAAWIGITRLQDYWHHWEDVVAGFVLGVFIAYICYRLHYPALISSNSGEPYAASGDMAGQLQRVPRDVETGPLVDSL